MKAVIISIHKNKAVILKDDGSFISVPNRNYQVGQVLKVKDISSTHKISTKLIRAAAAAACFLLLCFGVTYAYITPQSYVSLDVNPSIELNINMFDRVISANGVNDDGAHILEQLNISNQSMESAIEMIMYQLKEDGYIGVNGDNPVVVAVHCSNHNKEKKVMENTKLQMEQSLNNLAISTTVSIISVNKETIDEAHEMGTTGGILNLVQEYTQATGSQSNPQEIADLSIVELTEAIEDAEQEHADLPFDDEDDEPSNPHYDEEETDEYDDKDDEDDISASDEKSSNSENGNAPDDRQNHTDDDASEDETEEDNDDETDDEEEGDEHTDD